MKIENMLQLCIFIHALHFVFIKITYHVHKTHNVIKAYECIKMRKILFSVTNDHV